MSTSMIKMALPMLMPLLDKVTNTLEDMDKKYGVEGTTWLIDREYDPNTGQASAVLKFMHKAENPNGGKSMKPLIDPVTGKPFKYAITELLGLLTGENLNDEDED